ncbi:ciliogenesis-associated TTC17-interacting protein [Mus musculus]|uniref:Ciliogenesis-associated TTC17-interacting protein n=1 Tax=Mus musculus TaxID=10090 RepID=F7AAT1_MOUSE|nr:ciliogenesis-associated TTC17-interacting protein [Mus musculus]
MSSKVSPTVSKAKDQHHLGQLQQQQQQRQQQQPFPEANAEAISFLNSFCEPDGGAGVGRRGLEDMLLFFPETLAILSDTGEPQGELTIEVQRGKYKDDIGILTHCLLVHASSRGFLDKSLCGSSLLGYLNNNLELMEQHSQEFIKFPVLPMERKMSVLKQDGQFVVTRSVKEGEETKTGVSVFPYKTFKGFVSSAANVVLLRVMAWQQSVPSGARFLALDSEGKLCHCTYKSLGFQTIQVGNQQAKMFIVEQTIHSEEGIPFSCQYYLLPDGHLAKRVQVGSPGCCIITKMPLIREEDVIESPPTFDKKPLVWGEDLELYSKFLDRKEQLRLSHASYLRHHPEAQALVSDFLLFLLLRRPEDVVTFAAEHFRPFAALRSPIPALRSSHQPSPFRTLENEEEEEAKEEEEKEEEEEEEEEIAGEIEGEEEEEEIEEGDDYLYMDEDEDIEDYTYYENYYYNYDEEVDSYDDVNNYDDDDIANVDDNDDIDNYDDDNDDDDDDDDNDDEDDVDDNDDDDVDKVRAKVDNLSVDNDDNDVVNSDNVDVDNDNNNQG